jgi:CheY-like chemotaxis protein
MPVQILVVEDDAVERSDLAEMVEALGTTVRERFLSVGNPQNGLSTRRPRPIFYATVRRVE